MWPVKRPARLTKYNKQAWQCPARGRPQTNDNVSGTSALDRTPEDSPHLRDRGVAPIADESAPMLRLHRQAIPIDHASAGGRHSHAPGGRGAADAMVSAPY